MKKLMLILLAAAALPACSTPQTPQSADEARHSTPDKRAALPDPSGVSPAGSAFHNNGL
jgi:hypothetical protein